MDMILNSADNLGHAVHAFDDPAEVTMKTWLPFRLNEVTGAKQEGEPLNADPPLFV